MTILSPPPLPPELRDDFKPTFESELARILALPRRPVIDCERQEDRRWSEEAQALVDEETRRYTRGPRLSCRCRDRHIEAKPGGDLIIYSEGVPGKIPPLPVRTTIAEFCLDAAHDEDAVARVSKLRAGEHVHIPGFGRPCILEFKPVQAWTVREVRDFGGGVGFMPIGSGKTVTAFATVLASAGRVKLAVLLAKSDQRVHYVRHYLHFREHFRVPSLVMDQTSGEGGGSFVVRDDNVPILRFVAYTMLQNKKYPHLLDDLDPDLIVADEAHSLAAVRSSKRSVGSARAERAMRYLKKRNQEGRPVIFACWSGSLINKSLLDLTHLAAYALGTGSPYPIPQDVAGKWAEVVDPSIASTSDTTSTESAALRQAFGRKDVPDILKLFSADGVLDGIKQWSIETPGVISARSSSVNASLVIHERKLPKMPEALKSALEMVRNNIRPDGDEIVEEVKRIAIARNVGLGFYPYWAFPGQPCTCVAGLERCARCLRIADWYLKRKAFGRELRQMLAMSMTHLDTKALCVNAAQRAYQDPPYDGDLPVWPSAAWPAWAAVEKTVPHVSKIKWMDDYAARDAAEWAKTHTGIVWYETVAFGQKVAELAGIPFHGGGDGAEARILAESGKVSICASISSHSEGRDGLQFKFHKQLVCEPPASGKGWDQLLGRLLREGQPADEVETWVYLPVTETREAMRKAIMYAEFDEGVSPIRSTLAAALRAADIDFDL